MENQTTSASTKFRIAFYSFDEAGALATLRLLDPAKFMGIEVMHGSIGGRIDVDIVDNADIVVLQRDFSRDLDFYEQILLCAHRNNIPVVLDLDDLLFELPENHPDRISGYYAAALLPMLQAVMEVDLVTVATPELRDYILPYNSNVVVIPNYFDDNIWKMREPADPLIESSRITIGYMGGGSHLPDLQMIEPALLSIVNKSAKEVRFKFWGIEAPSQLAELSEVYWVPPKSATYADFAEFFQAQSADVVIAPLCDTFFNSCKSPIKYLEYGSIGVPGVYSAIAPYSRVVENGEDGFLVTSLEEWESRLLQLINDPKLRQEIAANAQAKIKSDWLLSRNAKEQYLVYKECIARHGIQKRDPFRFLPAVRMLARQMFEWKSLAVPEEANLRAQLRQARYDVSTLQSGFKAANKKISTLFAENRKLIYERQNLQNRIAEREKEIVDLEEEIVNYANSFSWRVTRPLRKIAKTIRRNHQ